MSSLRCKVCGKKAYKEYCFSHKPRASLSSNSNMKRSSIRKHGKHAQKWRQTRSGLLKEQDEWECVVGGATLDKQTVTFDHDQPRSRRPDLRYDKGNLHPMCFFHNDDKGSRDLEAYLESNPPMRCGGA